jgi:preprotein translocase subunit SecF
LALITGIVVGTFSTLFVASPISLDLILRFGVKHQAEPITAPTGRKPASV